MNDEKTIYTRLLTRQEIEAILVGLPALIEDLVGHCVLTVEYGTECNIHNDLQYQPMRVGIAWLHRFISESIDQRIYVPAKSELRIMTPDGGLEILLCHETDIHISGKDTALVRRATESALLKPLMK